MPFGWGLANTLVFKKAKTALGLDRCRFFMSGAAPIMKETLEFFYSLNMQLHEVYGMSESTGKLICENTGTLLVIGTSEGTGKSVKEQVNGIITYFVLICMFLHGQ